MQVVGIVLYIGLGLVQLFATFDGIGSWLGNMPWIIKAIISLILAYIPVVGSTFGLYGAISVWDWYWWQAVLLFFGISIAGLVGTLMFTAMDGLRNKQARSGQ